uniref:Uncharacterized protein n=1 Tax=Arundo donax TaxID=35708 RepID=A0A0A9EBH1_ARUDO
MEALRPDRPALRDRHPLRGALVADRHRRSARRRGIRLRGSGERGLERVDGPGERLRELLEPRKLRRVPLQQRGLYRRGCLRHRRGRLLRRGGGGGEWEEEEADGGDAVGHGCQ